MGFIEIKMKKKAIIISIKGSKLTQKEKILLSKEKPWGLILFKRNIKSSNQIKKLIIEIKKLTKDKKFPVIIDEEGLSVSRLGNIIDHQIDANFFGNLYQIDKKLKSLMWLILLSIIQFYLIGRVQHNVFSQKSKR